ncbi:MAG: hypothetical protein RR140_00530 [Clostridia bacterium]
MEKVALIQLDGKCTKLQIINTQDNVFYQAIDEISEPSKLAKDIAEKELVAPTTIKALIRTLGLFRSLCDQFKIIKVFAVVTDIIKGARNHKGVLEEIHNNTSFSFQIYSEEEEIKMWHSCVKNCLDISKGTIATIFDNKIYLTTFNKKTIIDSQVLNFGPKSVSYEFLSVPDNKERAELMLNFSKQNLQDVKVPIECEGNFVLAGEYSVSFGKLAKRILRYPLDIDNNYVISNEQSKQIFEVVKDLDLDRTKKLKGISEESADTIASTSAIIMALAEHCNVDKLTITNGTFLDGVIHASVLTDFGEKQTSDILGTSLESVSTFCGLDKENINQVYFLAVMLFKKLRVIHKLSREYYKPLRVGSQLYNSGTRISFKNYEKQSFNVILNCGLKGITHKDLLLGAFSALCQNVDNFELADWMKYKEIVDDEDLVAVRKLGVIISIAASLDCSKSSSIQDLDCDILGDSIIIKTISQKNVDFDIVQASKNALAFKKVFKKNLQII